MKKLRIVIKTDRVKEAKVRSRMRGKNPINKKHKSKKDYQRKTRGHLKKDYETNS